MSVKTTGVAPATHSGFGARLPRVTHATGPSTPSGLYVHVPFCVRRCGYCAFSTVAVGEQLDPGVADRFVASLDHELALRIERSSTPVAPLDTLYLGGGTPTMLPSSAIEALLGSLHRRVGLHDDAQVSIEANPDGLPPGLLEDLAHLGVTRISFGLQSVRPRVLALLDRSHDPAAALRAVEAARAAGIEHVSLDLMHGTPGERDDDWCTTLDAAIHSGVDHVSAYALSLEPGTKLTARVRRGALARPSDTDAARRYRMADQRLGAAGFEWYELSNWALDPTARSRHNLLYWRNGDWWGLGPSAHSHVDGHRWWNHRSLEAWSAGLEAGELPVEGEERLDAQQQRLEQVMLGLRLAEGLDADVVPEQDAIAALVRDGLLQQRDQRLVLTLDGRLLADLVVRSLVGA